MRQQVVRDGDDKDGNLTEITYPPYAPDTLQTLRQVMSGSSHNPPLRHRPHPQLLVPFPHPRSPFRPVPPKPRWERMDCCLSWGIVVEFVYPAVWYDSSSAGILDWV